MMQVTISVTYRYLISNVTVSSVEMEIEIDNGRFNSEITWGKSINLIDCYIY